MYIFSADDFLNTSQTSPRLLYHVFDMKWWKFFAQDDTIFLSVMNKTNKYTNKPLLLTLRCWIVRFLLMYDALTHQKLAGCAAFSHGWSISSQNETEMSEQTGSCLDPDKVSLLKCCFDLTLITFTCPLTVQLQRNKISHNGVLCVIMRPWALLGFSVRLSP